MTSLVSNYMISGYITMDILVVLACSFLFMIPIALGIIVRMSAVKKRDSLDFPCSTLTCYKPINSKVRVGRDNDGGYVIVDGYSYDLMLGCGISDDSSFEHAFLSKHPDTPIYAFDGTIKQFPNPHPKINFIRKNISDKNSETETNMFDLMTDKKDIFLKMDIETGEYPWFHALSKDQLKRIKQIVIEIHDPWSKYRYQILEKIASTHYLVHVHGNNCSGVNGFTKREGSIEVPDVFECTYIRKEKGEHLERNDIPFPTSEDHPNKGHLVDFKLSGFPYTK